MQKTIVMISTIAVFALATVSVNACPFSEKSASLTKGQVATSTHGSTSTSEAMSTFDPKHQPLFEAVEDAPEKPIVDKDITE